MKTIIFWALVLTSCTSSAVTNYYNQYGTYEGSAYRFGNHTNYYNYRGDYMGSQYSNDYYQRDIYEPSGMESMVPGSDNDLMPRVEDPFTEYEW